MVNVNKEVNMAKSKTRISKSYADMNDRQKKSFLYRIAKCLVKEAGFVHNKTEWPTAKGKECYISHTEHRISLYKAPDPARVKCPRGSNHIINFKHSQFGCYQCRERGCRWASNADCVDIWVDSPDVVKVGGRQSYFYELSMIDPLFISRLVIIINYAYDNDIFWSDITSDMCKKAFDALPESYLFLPWNLQDYEWVNKPKGPKMPKSPEGLVLRTIQTETGMEGQLTYDTPIKNRSKWERPFLRLTDDRLPCTIHIEFDGSQMSIRLGGKNGKKWLTFGKTKQDMLSPDWPADMLVEKGVNVVNALLNLEKNI
jgi:hypothetical protein